MLEKGAEHWWLNARQRMEAGGVAITWGMFKEEFLGKYFSADVRSKEEIEFLELKQGNMYQVADYAVKFEELSRFFTHYNDVGRKRRSVSSLRVVFV